MSLLLIKLLLKLLHQTLQSTVLVHWCNRWENELEDFLYTYYDTYQILSQNDWTTTRKNTIRNGKQKCKFSDKIDIVT